SCFFFSSRRRHTRLQGDWSSDVCSSDLPDCPDDAVIDLAGGSTAMEGDEDLLHRVVSNLVLNAVQAAGKGARVTVRTGRPAPQELPRGAGIENPVALAVSDNGPGIPENLRARLFDPFVTGRVGGTGLGL